MLTLTTETLTNEIDTLINIVIAHGGLLKVWHTTDYTSVGFAAYEQIANLLDEEAYQLDDTGILSEKLFKHVKKLLPEFMY